MADVTVAEYAQHHGLSEQVVRKQVRSGKLAARKSGSIWLIDDALRHRPAARRPLADRAADALLAVIDGRDALAHLEPTERTRLRQRLVLLREPADVEVVDVLHDWLWRRLPLVEEFFVQPDDLPDLRADERLVAGGVSDPRSEISAPDVLEAHVARADVDPLRREYLLRSSSTPNVALHVHDHAPERPLPLSQLVLDLIADDGPRERRRAVELLRTATS